MDSLRLAVVAYSFPREGPLQDVAEIVTRALELQQFIEVDHLNEDLLEVIDSIEPMPLVEASDSIDYAYSDFYAHLGVYPDFYRYDLLVAVDAVRKSRTRIDKVDASSTPLLKLQEFNVETLESLAERVPTNGDGAGLYRVFSPDELWFAGKVSPDHISAFFDYLIFPNVGRLWDKIVVSRYLDILSNGLSGSQAWEGYEDVAQMLLLEMLQVHIQDSDDTLLEGILEGLVTFGVVREAYHDFKESPWAELPDGAYKQMYLRSGAVDRMIKILLNFYEPAPQEAAALIPSIEKVVDYLIDEFAPIVGEWRLASFVAEVCKFSKCAIKRGASLNEEVSRLTQDTELVQVELNLGSGGRCTLALRPKRLVPSLTISKVVRFW